MRSGTYTFAEPFDRGLGAGGVAVRALLSVWDKRGLVAFAEGLVSLGVDLVASVEYWRKAIAERGLAGEAAR